MEWRQRHPLAQSDSAENDKPRLARGDAEFRVDDWRRCGRCLGVAACEEAAVLQDNPTDISRVDSAPEIESDSKFSVAKFDEAVIISIQVHNQF